MTPAQLEQIQNRLDKGLTSSADVLLLMEEVQRLQKKNQELEQDLTDLAFSSGMAQSAIQAWEEKFEHTQSSALTASKLLNEAREEIIVLKKRLKIAESRGKKGSCRYPEGE